MHKAVFRRDTPLHLDSRLEGADGITQSHTRTHSHGHTYSNPICHSTLLRNKVCLAVTLLVALYPLSCVDTHAHTHAQAHTHTISQVLNYNAANTEKHVWLGSFTPIWCPYWCWPTARYTLCSSRPAVTVFGHISKMTALLRKVTKVQGLLSQQFCDQR